MQLTLRSQMIAGATAVVGASAIAMTPVAPAVGIAGLSTAKAEVALSALANPITALLDTVGLVGNYTLNGAYTTPSVNWPNSGIGAFINAVLPTQGVLAPGLLPNIILEPLPIATALITNWLGYGYIAGSSALSAVGDVADILWSIPATAFTIALEVLTFDFAAIPGTITGAITDAINSATSAVTTVIDAATAIVGSIIAKGAGVVTYLADAIPTLLAAVVGQGQVLVGGVVSAFENIVAGITAPNPIEGVWNAAVNSLLSPAGLPGVVVNITQGAGVQVDPGDPATFVPSVRTLATSAVTEVADIINTATPSATASEAAPAAAAVRAEVASAPAAVEAAPAAEAAPSASDARSSADAEAAPAAAAPAAVEAAGGDSAPAADAPAKSGKGGASKGGRG